MNLQKRYLLMGGAVLAILLTLAAGLLFWGRRPFRGLEAADIAAATVLVGPPDVTLELDAGEIETLADLLADVRITRPDQYYSISLRTNPDGMAQPDLSMDISWYLSHSSRYSDGETPVLRLKMVEK